LFYQILKTATEAHPLAFKSVNFSSSASDFRRQYVDLLPRFEAARLNSDDPLGIAVELANGFADQMVYRSADQGEPLASYLETPVATPELLKLAANADPAAVAYEAVNKAVSSDVDVLLVDTAGRLHNKINLMNELSKIKRVMSKVIADAPHEVLLVLDGSTGQNAFEQAKQFSAATEVTSLAVTKLDGSAKGGVVLGISDQFNIPVRFIGVGEGIEDLQPFDAERFVDTFFEV